MSATLLMEPLGQKYRCFKVQNKEIIKNKYWCTSRLEEENQCWKQKYDVQFTYDVQAEY